MQGARMTAYRPSGMLARRNRYDRVPLSVPTPRAARPRALRVTAFKDEDKPAADDAKASSGIPAAVAPPAVSAQVYKQGGYLLAWYAANIMYNILNKQALNVFPAPWFMSSVQLGCGVVIMGLLWATKIVKSPKIDSKFLLALAPVAFFHLVAHVSACLSFSQVAVSFTHVVKSAEPVLSVLLSGPLLGQNFIPAVWLSLLPIVAGCSMSAMKEVSFAWSGFNNAMISNLGVVLRNIYSAKALKDWKHVDGINLYAWISVLSFLMSVPLAIAVEGPTWGASWAAASAKLGAEEVGKLVLYSGLFYHLYNQFSYMVLDTGISAVTFSVGNAMKRIAVIVSAVLFFHNPVSALNWFGSGLAILGTYLYSLAMVKQKEAHKKAEAAKA